MVSSRLVCWVWATGALAACGVWCVPARAAGCPDEAVRGKEVHGLQLPDCRDYEQVSTHDVNIDAEGFPGSVQSSPSGGRVRYWSVTPFPGVPGSCALDGGHPDYISMRGAGGGWSTEGILACEAAVSGKLGFSENLSEAVISAEGAEALELATGAPLTGRSYYLRYTEPTGGQRYRLLATVNLADVKETEEDYAVFLAGFSGDEQHLVFETKEKLLGEAIEAAPNVYEIDLEKPEDEQLSLVGVLPANEGGKPPPGGSVTGAGAYAWPALASPQTHYTQSAISRTGSRVFFTALPSERVYVRENPQAPQSPTGAKGECTVAVDACTLAVSQGAAHFRTATPDGVYAFYTEGEGLYRYDTETGVRETLAAPVTAVAKGDLTFDSDTITGLDVTAGEFHVGEHITGQGLNPSATVVAVTANTLTMNLPAEETRTGVVLSGSPGGVLGVAGVSDDGSQVYFAASGVLAANANSQGETAANEPKVADLYESYQPATGPPRTVFIARLINAGLENHSDKEDWNDSLGEAFPVEKSSRVSADGGTLLFASRRSLTGYNNGLVGCGGSTDACSELYRYRPGAEGAVGRLTCVSCNPDRETPPVYDAQLTGEGEGTGEIFEASLTRNLSENGNRIFFQTQDALVAGDTNKQADVYEWEADGEGSCRSETQDEGCLYLISSGTSTQQSYFGDASANGNDVFFFSRQALTPAEEGHNVNVYDARICEKGDHTCEEETPVAPASCTEECAAPSKPGPTTPTPASNTLTGTGNLTPTPPPPPTTTPKPPTNKERLAKALKACKAKHNKHKRNTCETQAHKHYPVKTTAKKAGRY